MNIKNRVVFKLILFTLKKPSYNELLQGLEPKSLSSGHFSAQNFEMEQIGTFRALFTP